MRMRASVGISVTGYLGMFSTLRATCLKLLR
jgi:hypothetical protein